ncbi:pyridoxamine 5-phosphate oxidase [Leucobacter sp. UCD-THU]|uniref:Pyridoxamine 5'-phosphate oxidase family protein n=1 Tax=Leucobacter muris TaxID=1935379 RepID=A0ABX5QD88_9MICO|nr:MULTISPECIES: pyridoxamine 5'-phosphate oxidase family protein [Leucobacter]EYT56734.1 pyridoxamine 5-phosphate oxidase [Leucobacter sp. UCD-THU]QAB16914.1 pyridoxamine 5'-phosphate oxidase family protein [Leucobacter muris]
MSENQSAVTVLSDDECWRRLGSQRVGRLVTSVGDVVDVVPINFVVDDGSVVFRTAPGNKLVELTINDSVLFEADEIGEESGWSVVVRGHARVLEAQAEVAEAEALPLKPFVPTLKPTFVRIEVVSIGGREYRFGPEPRREDQQEG